MELWKNAHHKSNPSALLLISSLVLGGIAFIICVGLSSKYYGFDQGYIAAREFYTELYKNLTEPLKFSGGVGPTMPEFIGEKYSDTALFLMLFLICRFVDSKINYRSLKTKIISHLINLSFLGSALYYLWKVIYLKSRLSIDFSMSEIQQLALRQSNSGDWICLSIITILLAIQIAELFASVFAKTK